MEDARAVAIGAGAPDVQPIHLLHSILKGVEVARLLASFVDVLELRTAVAQAVSVRGRDAPRPAPPYSSSCMRVIVHALKEASALGDAAVEGRHVLLGLLRMRPSRRLFGLLAPSRNPAYELLNSRGLSYETVRGSARAA